MVEGCSVGTGMFCLVIASKGGETRVIGKFARDVDGAVKFHDQRHIFRGSTEPVRPDPSQGIVYSNPVPQSPDIEPDQRAGVMTLSGLTQLTKAYIGLDLLLTARELDVDPRHYPDGARDILTRTRRAGNKRSAREDHDQYLCCDH